MNIPTDITIQTWVRLIRAQHSALSYVEKALKEQKLPPLCWYDILLELERVDQEGIRPFELEYRLLLPQYSVSRLIERIEKKGYLLRDVCEGDKRGQCLIITKAGKELRKKMWPVYSQAIHQAIGEKLTTAESRALSKHLFKLIE